MNIFQGGIYKTNLNPTTGSEQKGIRPVVVLSGNTLNSVASIIIICPLTTSLKNYYGDIIVKPTRENGLKEKSEVLVLQIRTISKMRLKRYVGNLTKEEVFRIIKGLNDILLF